MAPTTLRVNLGASRLSIDQIAAVAVLNAQLVVDEGYLRQNLVPNAATQKPAANAAPGQAEMQALLQRLDQNEQGHAKCPVAHASDTASPCGNSVQVSRAILLLQIQRLVLMKQTEATIEWIHLLVQLLNQQVTPLFSKIHGEQHELPDQADEFDLASLQLLRFVTGEGQCMYKGTIMPVAQAFEALKLQSPTAQLTPNQQKTFSFGATSLLAVACLILSGVKGLLPLAEAISACSCDVARVETLSFDADYLEAHRPYRGIADAATNLRLFLENSKYVNSKKAKPAPCFRLLPQYHGTAREGVLNALKSVDVELTSWLDSCSSKYFDFVDTQPLKSALETVRVALQVLLQKTKERQHTLQPLVLTASPSSPKKSTHSCPATASVCTVAQCFALMNQTKEALVKELDLSVAFFKQETQQLEKQAEVKAQKAKEAAAKAAAAAAKEDAKLAAMSEEQRQKVLEKRRKKLEKQKEKEAAKAAASGSSANVSADSQKQDNPLRIGLGNAALINFVTQKNAAGAKETSVHSLVNPFALYDETSLVAFIDQLLLQLNSSSGSGGMRRKPKIAKGAQDFLPHQMALREKIFNKIRMVFKRHAGVEIETPVFELKETLTGKYGEDSKLIYDLADQGGELLALRYDLTVPFARFMALHAPGNMKRFHIARVYRRDNPQISRGRFREFYQCDFDIAGQYAPMVADAEVLSIGIEVLQQFPEIGNFKVKLSHRILLDAILLICGVPLAKHRTICSAIDKLDKESWENVKKEMVEEKQLAPEIADRIHEYVTLVGEPKELHAKLMSMPTMLQSAEASRALGELKLLFEYLEAMQVLSYISFDLSLARGLDYYTGLIYEFVLLDGTSQVGSIAAGGRYDNLVGMFSGNGQQIPCVGVSMGIERIFGILQNHAEQQDAQFAKQLLKSQVFVASTNGSYLVERLAICKLLWQHNISAEIVQQTNIKFTKQLHYVLEKAIPFMVVIGEDELAKKQVTLKMMETKEEITIPQDQLVEELLKRNCETTNTLRI